MKQFFDNPVFAGALGLMVSGALMYLLRSVPVGLARSIWNRFVAEITVYGDNPAYHWAEEWLAKQPYAAKTRRLMISSAAENNKKLTLVPGRGRHVFFDGWRPIWFTRDSIAKEERLNQQASNAITISTIDLSRSMIEKIYSQIRDAAESRKLLRVFTCSSWGYWNLLLKRDHRSIDTVFVDSEIKGSILRHIHWYLNNRSWYESHGIPYRTGILLYGPPGTGKTSLVHALAGVFDLSVYMLNPSDIESENSLRNAMATVEQRAILLIEDADASIAPKRDPPETKPADPGVVIMPPSLGSKEVTKGPSLSAVLNALDGIAASDGRVLIMTTNHPERLDPALIRDGRVDLRVMVDKLGGVEALQMAKSFFPERTDLESVVDSAGPKTGAEWQTFFAEMSKPKLDQNKQD